MRSQPRLTANHHLQTVHKDSSAFTLFSLAATLVPAIVPFTILAMKPTNDALLHKADVLSTGAPSADPELDPLIARWSSLNIVRSVLVTAGGFAGAWALLGSPTFY